MKAVSAIMTIIILLMIVVALGGMTYMFSSVVFKSTTAKGEQQLGNATARMGGCIKIEKFDSSSKNITLRNCGYNSLGDFRFYVDSQSMLSYAGTLNPGGLLNLNLNIPQGDHIVYVTTNYAETSPKKVTITATCTGVQPPSSGNWLINSDTICRCNSGENITLIGNLYAYGSGSLTIDNCLLWLNQTSTYQYVFIFNDTSKTTIKNSILNSSEVFHPYWEGSSVNYFENVIFDRPHSGSAFQSNSINTFINVDFFKQIVFTGNSKSTIKNSRMISLPDGDNSIVIWDNSELNFQNSATIDWYVTSTNGIIRGNYTITGGSSGWSVGNKVTRVFPVVIIDTAGNPKSATVNITNKTNSVLIWGPQTVNGYAEPNITFNYTNYLPGNFTLYVYTTSPYKVNSTDINFLNNTPITLIL